MGTSISIMLQVNSYVQSENHCNFTMFLGQVMDCMASITMASRLIVFSAANNQPYTAYSQILLQKTSTIDVLLSDITDNLVYWSDCPASSFLNENIMPTAIYNKKGFYQLENLYDFLYTFQNQVRTI